MRDEILDELREIDATVGLTLSEDAPYEFFVDELEPTIGHTRTVERLSQTSEFEEFEKQYGVLVVFEELTEDCYACGMGTYQNIGSAAFQPIHDYFN